MMGYAPHPQKRSAKKFTFSGMFFTISLVITECALIYLSHDPNKFTKATKSNILNYGIYIQTEVSLMLALWFLLRACTKITKKWTVNEQFSEVDQILKNEFSMNLCYRDVKLASVLSAIAGMTAGLMLFGFTVYFLIDVPFDTMHKACICFSIYLSNISMYAITVEFIGNVSFVFVRFNDINNILRQLLFDDTYLLNSVIDESASRELIYTNYLPIPNKKNLFKKKSKFSSVHSMSEWMDRRKAEYGNQQKPLMKSRFKWPWTLFTKTFISKPTFYRSSEPSYVLEKLTTLIGLHERLTESVALLNDIYSTEVFFILMVIFTYVLFGLFSRYMVLFDYEMEAYKISSLNLTWMIAYTASILTVISMSSILTTRAKHTAVIVHRVLRKTNDAEIENKLFTFSKMLHLRRITLNFGQINFDWPLLFQLNGAVTSYLIILIQFQLSSKRH
ncbi:uncharacterized protein LOC119073214 [Bradysia coprophila]|uniref:uncharacterized protein LOC119073214 n=1 Tax=Bradysia coprophila TaxID=38358 RepID=UPI00187DD307|nr:uncharacterized protein LOC119073214 [Bradysia coprophila]